MDHLHNGLNLDGFESIRKVSGRKAGTSRMFISVGGKNRNNFRMSVEAYRRFGDSKYANPKIDKKQRIIALIPIKEANAGEDSIKIGSKKSSSGGCFSSKAISEILEIEETGKSYDCFWDNRNNLLYFYF